MNGVKEILVITEGATEREVGRMLYTRKILSHQGKPIPPNWSSKIGAREGYDQVIKVLKERNPIASMHRSGMETKALLVFDQEDDTSVSNRVQKIERDLRDSDGSGFWKPISFQHMDGFDNLFDYEDNMLHIVLHISDASLVSDDRGDFDGYILKLLQGPYKFDIATQLMRNKHDANELLDKAEKEITDLMQRNHFPWTHNKSWVYAYITAFQLRQSHVWFAENVVKNAPDEALKEVFAPLIFAWNSLAKGDSQS